MYINMYLRMFKYMNYAYIHLDLPYLHILIYVHPCTQRLDPHNELLSVTATALLDIISTSLQRSICC